MLGRQSVKISGFRSTSIVRSWLEADLLQTDPLPGFFSSFRCSTPAFRIMASSVPTASNRICFRGYPGGTPRPRAPGGGGAQCPRPAACATTRSPRHPAQGTAPGPLQKPTEPQAPLPGPTSPPAPRDAILGRLRGPEMAPRDCYLIARASRESGRYC